VDEKGRVVMRACTNSPREVDGVARQRHVGRESAAFELCRAEEASEENALVRIVGQKMCCVSMCWVCRRAKPTSVTVEVEVERLRMKSTLTFGHSLPSFIAGRTRVSGWTPHSGGTHGAASRQYSACRAASLLHAPLLKLTCAHPPPPARRTNSMHGARSRGNTQGGLVSRRLT